MKRILALGLLASCTSAQPRPEAAACAVVRNVVHVTPGQLEVRAGLSTWSTALPEGVSPIHERVRAWREERMRPACSGASDVVAGSDEASAVSVLVVGGALSPDCEDCSPGAMAMLAPGDSPPEPPAPQRSIHADLDAALEVAALPHGGLPPCQDGSVAFEERPQWGEVRRVLSQIHRTLPHRLTASFL